MYVIYIYIFYLYYMYIVRKLLNLTHFTCPKRCPFKLLC